VVADLFGSTSAARVIAAGRRAFESMRDSVVRATPSLGPDERRAAAAIARQRFDDQSFAITMVDGRPAVYICENFACQAPITEAAALKEEALPRL